MQEENYSPAQTELTILTKFGKKVRTIHSPSCRFPKGCLGAGLVLAFFFF